MKENEILSDVFLNLRKGRSRGKGGKTKDRKEND